MRRRLKKEYRTRPIKGRGEDEGRYFHCSNCGFPCDKERDTLASSTEDGMDYENFPVPAYGSINGSSGIAVADVPGHFHVAAQVDAENVALPVFNQLRPVSKAGCPLCGTFNWDGNQT